MKKLLLAALAAIGTGVAGLAVSQSGAFDTWQKVANDGQAFTIPGNSLIRYGRPGLWVNALVVGTSGTCSVAALGLARDPAPGQTKQCDRRNGPVLTVDSNGGVTTHKFGLEVTESSTAAANALVAKKPGVTYPTLSPVTPPYPSGQPGNQRPSGFTTYTGNQDGTTFSLDEGAVRTLCNVTHYSHDDAIVHPGEPDSTHGHTFFGNGAIDAYTTVDNIRVRGKAGVPGKPRSSCIGGSVNLSAYWVPSMLQLATKNLVPPAKPILVYYKTLVWPFLGNNPPLEGLPLGIRMVTGDANRTTTDDFVQTFNCYDSSGNNVESARGITNRLTLTDMANCNQAGDVLWQRLAFAQCWNGELDSTNHRSHVVQAVYTGGQARVYTCPNTHPLVLVGINEIAKYTATTGSNPGTWALASDAYLNVAQTSSLPKGLSGHADYMMGWDKTISDRFMQLCEREGRDCGSWGVGDGRGAIAFQGNSEN